MAQPTKQAKTSTRKPPTADLLRRRIREMEQEIREYEAVATEAREVGPTPQLAAAVAAMKSITGLRDLVASHRAELVAMTIRDPLDYLGFMRVRAAAAGSWVAAKDLTRDERVLRAEIDAAAKAAAEAAAKDLPQLMAEMDRILTDMPESLRAELLAKWLPRTG